MNANARKTECLRGHPFTASNTYINSRGSRQCRACRVLDRAEARRTKSLDPKAIARLRDAVADGVPILLVAERFGIGKGEVSSYLKRAS